MSIIVPWPAGRECNDLVTTIVRRGSGESSGGIVRTWIRLGEGFHWGSDLLWLVVKRNSLLLSYRDQD